MHLCKNSESSGERLLDCDRHIPIENSKRSPEVFMKHMHLRVLETIGSFV